MNIKEYFKPTTLEEAYDLCSKGAVILGGGAFLNLSDKVIDTAVDIDALGLDYIIEDEMNIEIGCMATLRELEINPITKGYFSGVLSKAAASIMGVQVRNVATIGGSIYGKYAFSDMITVLLALDAHVELYYGGVMSLESFMDQEIMKDILVKIIIDKKITKAAFACMRKTDTDFSMLNAAAAIAGKQLRLAVGARPGKSRLAKGAMNYFNLDDDMDSAAALAVLAVLSAEELQFGSDVRASAEYRYEICKTLIKRCGMEVMS